MRHIAEAILGCGVLAFLAFIVWVTNGWALGILLLFLL